MTVYGYIRVSTNDQTLDSQRHVINQYCLGHGLSVDEWMELEISSRKSLRHRRIDELLEKLVPGDTVLVSELSRLGRSIAEVLNIIESILTDKNSRLILIKQSMDLNPQDRKNMTNKVLITVFSMIAELERDFISERTKEGLRAVVAKGKKLGKPKGTIQASMYDNDKEKILHLKKLGVSTQKIVELHLGYGNRTSLFAYIKRHSQEKLAKTA